MFISCNENIYGIYNNSYSKDKSAFFQIKINANHTMEREEIHTIGIYSKGTWIEKNNYLICYIEANYEGFPKDTLIYKVHNRKLFPVKNDNVNKNFYLKKVSN